MAWISLNEATKHWETDGIWKVAPAGLDWMQASSIGEGASIGQGASIEWASIGEWARIGARARATHRRSIGHGHASANGQASAKHGQASAETPQMQLTLAGPMDTANASAKSKELLTSVLAAGGSRLTMRWRIGQTSQIVK
jgi:carbonic anhydrase/acetyltransferase-like protein (isoleucine patch superfamily)